jgi:galactokinase
MNDINQLFAQHFGSDGEAFTVRSPGRVNLIGEHVDYNDGFVLPMAISLETTMRVRPRSDRTVDLYAANFDDRRRFSLDDLSKQEAWIDYVQGVAQELAKRSVPLHGFEGVIISTVPIASGLSSSASFEVAATLVFTRLAEQPVSPSDAALLSQAAENNFVGVNCGIMDQMAVAACQADHALLIDCRSLDLEQVPFRLSDHVVVVTDSGAPRELASSAYNERRAQCEIGVITLQKHLSHVESLRDVTTEDFSSHEDAFSPLELQQAFDTWKATDDGKNAAPNLVEVLSQSLSKVPQRARHVVEEIARTLRAVQYLRQRDLTGFGRCMNESHASLAKLYEVTSPELDWLAEWSQKQPGVLGSRMTGAGFGGCTVTLIEKAHAGEFMRRLPQEYKQAMNRDARCWACEPVAGAEVLS